MQQHEYSPQSMHLVLPPPVASAGLVMLSAIEVAALPGPLRLTRDGAEEQAIVPDLRMCVRGGFGSSEAFEQ